MNITQYQVDAFASRPFEGNPAAVCVLDAWLSDTLMQSIAAENNLSETAFLVMQADGYALRWFTPVSEVDLCGHATLAAAHCQLAPYWAKELNKPTLVAKQVSKCGGVITCQMQGNRSEERRVGKECC